MISLITTVNAKSTFFKDAGGKGEQAQWDFCNLLQNAKENMHPLYSDWTCFMLRH